MSDYKTALYANFINRRTGQEITEVPLVNRISLNKDIRQLCDSFDFDFIYRLSDSIDLKSHDFVEFYFIMDNAKFQVGCGFIEDFVKETSANTHRFQANGRDFLGQLFNLPFLKAKPFDQTTISKFTDYCLTDAYLPEYLGIKGITRKVIDKGAFTGPIIVPELTDAKIGPVLQHTADEVFNLVYQNRFGQVVIWGRSSLDDLKTNQVISEYSDDNSMKLVLRENYSKVFSEVKVLYTGGEANIDYQTTPSNPVFNSDPKARQIFQPEVRSFQTSTLITTSGAVSLQNKKDQLAASILRKSNQNLTQVVISCNNPFYVAADGTKIPYEVNQLWKIDAPSYKINEEMRLVGIGYTQDEASLKVELLFIGKDTLV